MKKSKQRRVRPGRLELLPGQIATIERPECGRNKGLPQLQQDGRVAPARVQVGVFQLTRLKPKPARSKYNPQAEDVKHAATNSR